MKIIKCSNCEYFAFKNRLKDAYCKLKNIEIIDKNEKCNSYKEYISYDMCIK